MVAAVGCWRQHMDGSDGPASGGAAAVAPAAGGVGLAAGSSASGSDGPASGGAAAAAPAAGGVGLAAGSSASGSERPAFGGAAATALAADGVGLAAGSFAVLADRHTRRWHARQVDPWDHGYHTFRFSKQARTARIDLQQGEWSKELLEQEVKNHPQIYAFERVSGKSWHEHSASGESRHECDTDYRCHMEGDYVITIGYSRFKDRAGCTHGWVLFGKDCRQAEQKVAAVVTMLNCMGFEAPALITVPPSLAPPPQAQPATGGVLSAPALAPASFSGRPTGLLDSLEHAQMQVVLAASEAEARAPPVN